MPYDLSDPQAVFNQLAQLRYEDDDLTAKLEALEKAQAANHDEFARLERVALAYLKDANGEAVKCHATTEAYTWERLEYTLIPDDPFVLLYLIKSIFRIPPLTAEQLQAAFGDDPEPASDDEIDAIAENFEPFPTEVA